MIKLCDCEECKDEPECQEYFCNDCLEQARNRYQLKLDSDINFYEDTMDDLNSKVWGCFEDALKGFVQVYITSWNSGNRSNLTGSTLVSMAQLGVGTVISPSVWELTGLSNPTIDKYMGRVLQDYNIEFDVFGQKLIKGPNGQDIVFDFMHRGVPAEDISSFVESINDSKFSRIDGIDIKYINKTKPDGLTGLRNALTKGVEKLYPKPPRPPAGRNYIGPRPMLRPPKFELFLRNMIARITVPAITAVLVRMGTLFVIALVASLVIQIMWDFLNCLSIINDTIQDVNDRYWGKTSCWKKINGKMVCQCSDIDCLGQFGLRVKEYRDDVIECCKKCRLAYRAKKINSLPAICNSLPLDPKQSGPPYGLKTNWIPWYIQSSSTSSVYNNTNASNTQINVDTGTTNNTNNSTSNLQSSTNFSRKEETIIDNGSVIVNFVTLEIGSCKKCLASAATIRNDKVTDLYKRYDAEMNKLIKCINPSTGFYDSSLSCSDKCFGDAMSNLMQLLQGLIPFATIASLLGLVGGAAGVGLSSFQNNYVMWYEIDLYLAFPEARNGVITPMYELCSQICSAGVQNENIRTVVRDLTNTTGRCYINENNLIKFYEELKNYPLILQRFRDSIVPVAIRIRQVADTAQPTFIRGWELIRNFIIAGGGFFAGVRAATAGAFEQLAAALGLLLTTDTILLILGAIAAAALLAACLKLIYDTITCKDNIQAQITKLEEQLFGKESCWDKKTCTCSCTEPDCTGELGEILREYASNVAKCCGGPCKKEGIAGKLPICTSNRPTVKYCGPSGPPSVVPKPAPISPAEYEGGPKGPIKPPIDTEGGTAR